MRKHEHHDLLIHDDDELSAHLGSRICQRTVMHEWPLSRVEKLRCQDGRQIVYKSQTGPTVEPDFYARASGGVLPQAETLYQSNGRSCMLIEYIDAPRLQDMNLAAEQVLLATPEVLAAIRSVSGDVPFFLDISTPGKWNALVDATVVHLRDLVDSKRFTIVTTDTVQSLDRHGHSPIPLSAFDSQIGLIHGDPNGGNVFVTTRGYRVIDWQRVMLGPQDVDLVAFLVSHGLTPEEHVDRGLVAMFHFLRVWWLTQCKIRWIPDARSYDRTISELAATLTALLE